MSALQLKALVIAGGLVLFGAGVSVGKYSRGTLPTCVVVDPNSPAFTLTDQEKKDKEKFYRDLAEGQKKDREMKKRWVVP